MQTEVYIFDGSIGQRGSGKTLTENASRNIPNIGKNVPDAMCGLDDSQFPAFN